MTHNKTLLLLASLLFACPMVFAQTTDNKFLTSEDVIELELRHDLTQRNRLSGKFATVEDSYRTALLERFLAYTKIDSQSQLDDSMDFPMNDNLRRTAALLYQEIQLFAKPAGWKTHLSENQYIYVHIPSNIKKQVPVLGFSAHYDTTPDIPGSGIKARVIKNYDGGDVVINQEKNIIINPQNEPYLANVIGQTIVVSDGNTMLSADDKAGVATVVTAMQTLAENPNIKHGPIQVVITPNEDVGRSAERLELEYYHPDYAYDFDGGVNGEVVVGNFNAEKVIYKVHGVNGHQSMAAENGYRNAWKPACELGAACAKEQWLPNNSTGKQGYVELHHMDMSEGKVNVAELDFRLRDFNQQNIENWKHYADSVATQISGEFGVKIEREVYKQYGNVAENIHPQARQVVTNALQNAGITPNFKEERAGTTASMLMLKLGNGAYTLFTGQNNPHAFTEWLSEEDMYKAFLVALNLTDEVVMMK